MLGPKAVCGVFFKSAAAGTALGSLYTLIDECKKVVYDRTISVMWGLRGMVVVGRHESLHAEAIAISRQGDPRMNSPTSLTGIQRQIC